ncbi:MAG: hypothetical protein ACM3SU_17945 [Acidobacteriota bacterium]
MRAAAVASFLEDLRAHGSADLNAVLTTLNDGSLIRESLGAWVGNGWIVIAPSSKLQALTGPAFTRELTLERFCGGGSAAEPGSGGTQEGSRSEEEASSDENP